MDDWMVMVFGFFLLLSLRNKISILFVLVIMILCYIIHLICNIAGGFYVKNGFLIMPCHPFKCYQ